MQEKHEQHKNGRKRVKNYCYYVGDTTDEVRARIPKSWNSHIYGGAKDERQRSTAPLVSCALYYAPVECFAGFCYYESVTES